MKLYLLTEYDSDYEGDRSTLGVFACISNILLLSPECGAFSPAPDVETFFKCVGHSGAYGKHITHYIEELELDTLRLLFSHKDPFFLEDD
jgi:hypothetical protein